MSEHLKNGLDNERNDERPQSTIEELLPRYYEANGDILSYRILRSIPIDGHDVAWMEYSAQNFSACSLHCACDFAEGVGWQIEDDGTRVSLDGGENCLPRQVAQYLRQQEIQREYLERFRNGEIFWGEVYDLWEHIPEIVVDLLDRDAAGEFVGERGAYYQDGHLFAETIAKITEIPMIELWPILDKMKADKVIYLDGGVIQRWNDQSEFNQAE